LKRLALLLSVALAPAFASAQGRTENLVSEHGAWSVYTETDPRECFAVSAALDGPLPGSRIAPGLLVAIWPDRGGLPEFSFTTEGPGIVAGVRLVLDDLMTWPMMPEGNWAWPDSAAADAAIAAMMPMAGSVMVAGQLTTGKGFQARFSLDGYVAALAQARQLCGENIKSG